MKDITSVSRSRVASSSFSSNILILSLIIQAQHGDIIELRRSAHEGADTVLVVTPSSEGATSGKFDLSLDLTGKLTAGEPYYFHLGPVGGSGYRPNIYAPKDMELATVEVTGGKYVLSIGEGYTGENEGWRNGLALVTFTPSN